LIEPGSPSDNERERVKLTANFLNALASGTILAAVVGPYISIGFGIVQARTDLWNVLGISGFGFVVGVMLHLLARRMFRIRRATE
jgi:hypothetical protein